ncbi:hypothetical protein RKD48_006638 [Streptomyces ambofaciens]
MTDQTAPRDRLFALIASIPGSASVDWCDDARALVDEIATPPAPLPAVEARTRLLQALDAPYCQALGFTPEGLLAAYEASRTETVDRDALSAKLWEIAERHIVAEWICCEPLEPGHDLCAKGYEALGMVKSLLVDADPGEAWNPSAPLLSALAAVLPAPVDHDTDTGVTPPPALTEEGRLRARVQVLEEDAERDQGLAATGARCLLRGHQGLIESGRVVIEGHRFALSVKLGLGTDESWDAIHERVAGLRRVADETATTETQARRGDQFEAWLKAQRDEYEVESGPQWRALDEVLDTYRLHADTGTPLGEHVCEAPGGRGLRVPGAVRRRDVRPRQPGHRPRGRAVLGLPEVRHQPWPGRARRWGAAGRGAVVSLAARRTAALEALSRREPSADQLPDETRPSGAMPTDWREALAYLDARDRMQGGEEAPPV